MAENEVVPEAPAWMLALEKKRQRIHKLAHEVGAGSPCILCKEACPGLDLHFWRKICRNCKCKKEDHEVVDDYGYEQFEILLGSGHSKSYSKKAFLELLEKQTSLATASKVKRVAFDWIPPNVTPDVAAEYMQSLPASKLPISGSDGALYRRQQLEKQLPLHDLDANHCHQLTDVEVDNLKKYLENLQSNVVGQGRISKYSIPISKSVETLQNLRSFNSAPKPFRMGPAQNLKPQIINDQAALADASSATQNLKPPSAFLPRNPSPDRQSLSMKGTDLLSVADRGALFGVTLSPSSRHKREKQKSAGQDVITEPLPPPNMSLLSNEGLSHPSISTLKDIPKQFSKEEEVKSSGKNVLPQSELNCHLVKNSIPNLVAYSGNVPGSMWVPDKCSECSQRAISGQIVSDKICSHVSRSDQLSHNVQIGISSPAHFPSGLKPLGLNAGVPVPSNFTDTENNKKKNCLCPNGAHFESCLSVLGPESHVASSEMYGSGLIPQTSSLMHGKNHVNSGKFSSTATSTCQDAENIVQSGDTLSKDVGLDSSNPSAAQFPSLVVQGEPNTTNLSIHSMEEEQRLSPRGTSPLRSISPSSGISGTGSPHALALYAHNALHSPAGLDPQDRLSPHVASLALDDPSCDGTEYLEGTPVKQSLANSRIEAELLCAHCCKNILPGEVVVFADRAGPDVVWHPQCFVCNTCQELLVDLVYFFSKGHVYCGRHFAELLDIPRCSACDELIFVKEYTVAEGQAFHVKHFCCFECDDALGGKQYVPKDGQPVCLPCYEQKYGKTCQTCGSKIGARDQGVTWKNIHWHAKPECFCCAVCCKSLLGGRFAVKEERPFCSKECMKSS